MATRSNNPNYVIGLCVWEIFSRLLLFVVRNHLEKFSLINDSYNGFTKDRSYLTNLMSFHRKVYEAVDNDENYDIIYLDFSKSFDKVPHERLLSKVRVHGINRKVLRWIRSWLYDRQQRVTINSSKSKWGLVASGAPQGSVFGQFIR